MRLEMAKQAIGRSIRRPGQLWQPAEQLIMVPVEDALADDWEIQLPAGWVGELSAAHLRAVLHALYRENELQFLMDVDLIALLLAPLGVHRGDLEQLCREALMAPAGRTASAPARATKHKPVRRKAKAKRGR